MKVLLKSTSSEFAHFETVRMWPENTNIWNTVEIRELTNIESSQLNKI